MNENIDLGKLYGFSQCTSEGCGQIMPNNVGNTGTQMGNTSSGMDNNMPQQMQGVSSMPAASMNDQMIISPQFRNTFSETGANPEMMQQNPEGSIRVPFTYEQFPTLNGFIRTQIGRRVRAEFLIGSNTLNVRDGYLVGVGSNYLLINEIGTKTITAGDFYNLKFVSFPY